MIAAMRLIKKHLISALFIAFFIVLLSFTACGFVSEKSDGEKKFTYFYEEVCDSCDNSEKVDRLTDKIHEGGNLQSGYKLEAVNVFTDTAKKWETACDGLEIPLEERQLPMLVSDESYIFGDVAINDGIRAFFSRELSVLDDKSIFYYYRPECKDCTRIEDFIDEVFNRHPEYSVLRIDTTEEKPKEAFKKLLADKKISKEEWQVPFLIVGDKYLSGDKEIEEKLVDILEKTE